MSLRDKLIKMTEESGLNFTSVLDYANKRGLEVKDANLITTIFGLASHECIFVDIDKMLHAIRTKQITHDKALFIFYHEIAHYIRIHKIGVDEHVRLITNEDIVGYMDYVIREEIFADRWGSFMYYLNTRKQYPKHETQCLDNEINRRYYETRIAPEHKFFVGKTIDDYKEILKKYVINVRR